MKKSARQLKQDIHQAALMALRGCAIRGNILKMGDKPPSAIYDAIDKLLEGIGGKYKGGRTDGFVFAACEEAYVRGLIDDLTKGVGPAVQTSPGQSVVKTCRKCGVSSNTPGNGGPAFKFVSDDLCSDCYTHVDDLKPAPAKRVCRVCGCSEMDACKHPKHGNCWWVEDDLCSHCQLYPGEAIRISLLENEAGFSSGSLYSDGFGMGSQIQGDPMPLAKMLRGKRDAPEIKPIYPIPPPEIVAGKPEITYTKPNIDKMKQQISVPTAELRAILKKATEVVEFSKKGLPVLANVLVKVGKKSIEVTASDLIITLVAVIEIDNEAESGYNFLLPFRFLLDICGAIDEEYLTIDYIEGLKKVDGNNITTRSAMLSTVSDSFNVEEMEDPMLWPEMPQFNIEKMVGISPEFVEWMNVAAYTVADASANTAMCKVFVHIEPERMTIASTNGYVCVEKHFETPSKNPYKILVHPKIARALKGFGETTISYSDSHVAFVTPKMQLIGTVQDEKFPNYQAMMPPEAGNLTLPYAELKNVMEKILINKTDTHNPLATIWLKREIGLIVIEDVNKDYLRTVAVRLAHDYSGMCEKIIIDPRQMLNLLKQIKYVTLTLTINGPSSAVLITSKSDASYRSIIMPLA